MEGRQERKASRLVFVLFPYQGHINPMLQLATALNSKGFAITIVHPKFNSPNPSNHTGFTFVPIPDNLSESQVSSGNAFGVLSALNKNCEEPLKECIQQMLKAEDQPDRISCIIYDSHLYFAQSVADHLKLPGISVRTSVAATLLPFAVFPRHDGQGYISYLDCISQDQEPQPPSLWLKDIAAIMKQSITDNMLELRDAVASSLKNCSAIVVNTVDFLEEESVNKTKELFSASIFTVGPVHKLAPTISSSLLKEDTTCISWLDRQAPNSVLYVSFGSMARMDEKELLETAMGLANSDQSFLWVVRPSLVRGSQCKALFPKNFEERVGKKGCIVEWAPQREVLAHGAVGGFWTHCGWNSTLESICEGVPMLCRPFSGDQKVIVRYVCDVWNVGLELEGELERGKIEKVLRRLMVDTEGEKMRERAMHLKQKADLCQREGGSSYNSLNDLAEQIST